MVKHKIGIIGAGVIADFLLLIQAMEGAGLVFSYAVEGRANAFANKYNCMDTIILTISLLTRNGNCHNFSVSGVHLDHVSLAANTC